MANVPTPIRVALGLAAVAVDEARKLPERMPQLPMTAVSTAMQASLRLQQHLAEWTVRGDEVLSRLHGPSDEPPAWATFDDDAPAAAAAGNGRAAKAAFELVAPDDVATPEDQRPEPEDEHAVDTLFAPPVPVPAEPVLATAAPAKKAAAKKVPAKKTAGKVAPEKPAKDAAKKAAKKLPPEKAAAKKVPAKKASAKKAAAKIAEPIEAAARRAEGTDHPTPSTAAAEIVQAHQHDSE